MTNLKSLYESLKDGNTNLDDNLPTFGGVNVDCAGVWSWDETHVIWGDCVSELEITTRSDALHWLADA